MKNFSIAFFLISTGFFNCAGQSDHSWNHLSNPEVIKLIENYPLTTKEIDNAEVKTYRTPFSMLVSQYYGILLGYEFENEEFEKKFSEILDTHRPLGTLSRVKVLPGAEEMCDFEFIIPNVQQPFFLYKDFVLNDPDYYIFNVKEGRFTEDAYLNYETICTDIKHGYSSGVAVDKISGRMVHWMLAW